MAFFAKFRLMAGRGIAFLAVLAAVLPTGLPAWAQRAVDLELVLAVDASGSVSQERFVLQQRGYVAAFRDPRLLQAFIPGGSWLTPKDAVAQGDWARIQGLASQAAALRS